MKMLLYALVSLISLAFAAMSPRSGAEIEALSAEVPSAAATLLTATAP